MNLLRLGAMGLLRNPLRSGLTVLGVAVAIVTFVLLRTVIWAYNAGAEAAVPDRIVTRHKVTFVMPLPRRYVDVVRETPGVAGATWAAWWGGRKADRPEEFFATFAVDPDTWFTVMDEMKVPSGDLAAWKEDKQGVIVGDLLASKFGWKKGDVVQLESTIYPGEWQFKIDGFYEATRRSVDRQTFIFHWDYFNDGMPADMKEQIGWINARTEGDPLQVAKGIDRVFDERDVQTITQDEATFQRSFLAGFSAILTAINIVSYVILGIMAMILGNTVAMGVRERTAEYGVLRAIGFLPQHLAVLVLGEAVALGVAGGAVGLLIAYPVVELGIGRFVEENMSGFFPYFRVSAGNAALAFALAVGLSVVASGLSAWQASRLNVVDALRRVA